MKQEEGSILLRDQRELQETARLNLYAQNKQFMANQFSNGSYAFKHPQVAAPNLTRKNLQSAVSQRSTQQVSKPSKRKPQHQTPEELVIPGIPIDFGDC